MSDKDTYRTIVKPSREVLFKDKNSKFYGYAFPVQTEDDVKVQIDALKKKHHAARHWCYAYQIGVEDIIYRANDDGEPNNSAGMPIYGQIQSFELTNVLIVIVRYFGGVKLGVGGLIQAYKTAAQMAIEASKITTKRLQSRFKITCDYKNLNSVMRIIKENQLKIENQIMELQCELVISVRQKNADLVFENFDRLFEVEIKKL